MEISSIFIAKSFYSSGLQTIKYCEKSQKCHAKRGGKKTGYIMEGKMQENLLTNGMDSCSIALKFKVFLPCSTNCQRRSVKIRIRSN